MTSGNGFSAGIHTNGTLWGWGTNASGQLGQSNTTTLSSPAQIAGTWSDVSAGSNFALAIKNDQTLWAWGLNNFFQLGQGDTVNYSSPMQIPGSWTMITTGAQGTQVFALKK